MFFEEPDPTPRVGRIVHLHDDDDEWYHQGEIIRVHDGQGDVDFADWVERWPLADLVQQPVIGFRFVLVPRRRGLIVRDFRQPGT